MYRRSWPRAIVHLDADAFFATCEQALHPEYRGKPVITGKERGIVAAASYEAKALGIGRGTPLWEVKKIAPHAIIVPSDYESYSLFSKRMFEIMRRYTPDVEEYSIDEAFAEITGLRRTLHGSYTDIARRMKEDVERELGISVSVGVSLSKTLAKVASKRDKPSAVVTISGHDIEENLRRLDVEDVWGIGRQSAEQCRRHGIRTAYDFARQSEAFIHREFHKPQQETWRELNGEKVLEITTELHSKYLSISKTKTFTPASTDRAFVLSQLMKNLENACIKARRHSRAAHSVSVFLKTQEFRYVAATTELSRATAFPIEFAKVVRTLFDQLYRERVEYRATGITLLELVPEGSSQLSFFDEPTKIAKFERLYGAVDALSEKFGKHSVRLGVSNTANTKTQHVRDRGDVTERKMTRLKGESSRKHTRIPRLLGKVT